MGEAHVEAEKMARSGGIGVTGTTRRRLSTRGITAAGLLAALLAACAPLALPIGPVPVTLQTFVVILIALLLSPGEAVLSVGVYLLAGAAGLPVFSGMRGGLGVLAGPTGGFLIGFLVAAVAGSALRGLVQRVSKRAAVADAGAAAVAIGIIYAVGLAFVAAVHPVALAAVSAAVAPLVIGDIAKAVVAIGVAAAIRRATPNRSDV